MKKSIKIIALALSTIILSVIALNSLPVFADCSDVCDPSCKVADSVKAAAGCNASTNDKLPNVVQGILNAIIAVAGVIAVVFVVKGGVDYITSAGDAGKLKKAKDTILYAVIGLVICALAFAIVNFVIIQIIGGSDNVPAINGYTYVGDGGNRSDCKSNYGSGTYKLQDGHCYKKD